MGFLFPSVQNVIIARLQPSDLFWLVSQIIVQRNMLAFLVEGHIYVLPNGQYAAVSATRANLAVAIIGGIYGPAGLAGPAFAIQLPEVFRNAGPRLALV